MGPLQSFYASPAHHPFLLWFLIAAFLAKVLSTGMVKFKGKAKRDPSLQLLGPDSAWLARFLAGFCGVGILDVWLTTTQVPILGVLEGTAGRVIPFAFVVAGDWRVFWVLFRHASQQKKPRLLGLKLPPWALSLAMAWVVPLLSEATMRLAAANRWFGDWSRTGRGMFLIYETEFFVLATVLWATLFKKDRITSRILLFVMGYYALWALGDALILGFNEAAAGANTAIDWPWAPRLAANLLYYGGLLPWIYYLYSRKPAKQR